MKPGLFIAVLFIFSGFSAVAQNGAVGKPSQDIISACHNDCKDAINAATEDGKAQAAHECAEKKGRLNKVFKKSKCWEINEIYEKEIAEKKKSVEKK
ncbi:MAG: hypothetical protein K2Q26_12250 [Bdellovibrionales bacterium]|nr:hypothetical protein [Bdellovibrionales bacterium]